MTLKDIPWILRLRPSPFLPLPFSIPLNPPLWHSMALEGPTRWATVAPGRPASILRRDPALDEGGCTALATWRPSTLNAGSRRGWMGARMVAGAAERPQRSATHRNARNPVPR